MKNKYLVILLFFALNSCTPDKLEYGDYVQYLLDEENGLIQTKSFGGLKISVKYLPVDYQVYNELKAGNENVSKEVVDSLKNTYKNSFSFLMTLAPAEGESFDVTKVGVTNYEEFSQRITDMSFNMGGMIKLISGEEEIYPEIAQAERLYGLRNSVDILLVFNADNTKINNESVELMYSDEIFNTGISKYKFKLKDINSIPELAIK